MKICYFLSDYVSHRKAGLGNRLCLEKLGVEVVDDPDFADLIIIHNEPPTYPFYFERYPPLENTYVIAYAVWETDCLPDAYIEPLSQVDEIWTPSAYTEKIFKKRFQNVIRIPHLVEMQPPGRTDVQKVKNLISYREDLFYFYTIVDSLNPRKNLSATLSAFERLAAQYMDRLRLVVKQYARIDEGLGELPNIISIKEPVDSRVISALHEVCNALVSSHCAEAWGLSISDAMAHGNPVIATGYSGNMDYMRKDNAYPVLYAKRNLDAREVAFAPQLLSTEMSWAQVDEDNLYEKMRDCFLAGGQSAEARRAPAIQEHYGIEPLSAIMGARLQHLMSRIRPVAVGSVHSGTALKSKKGGNIPPSRVGIFHQLPEDYSVMVGRQVAVDQFVLSLARYGKRHSYELYCPTMQVSGVRQNMGTNLGKVSVYDRLMLSSQVGEFGFTAWHDPQFEIYRAFALRANSKASFPITILHHTLSYKELLHERFLQLLLCNPCSYDSIICSSTSSQNAVQSLLEHVLYNFNESYGTKLVYGGRTDVIPLAVDTELFQPSDKAQARKRFELPLEAFILLWVGRLSAIDKADLLPLVQVVSELKEGNPTLELLLVCVGNQRCGEHFGDMIREFGKKLNVVDNLVVFDDLKEGIHRLYPAADVFVSPVDNLQESFGLSPVEAMACGVPQVVSDWNGYRDTVVHGKTGFLISTYTGDCWDDISEAAFLTDSAFDHLVLSQSVVVDPAALRGAIQQLIDSPGLRTSMSEISRQRAVQKYSWRSVIAQYEDLWSELSGLALRNPEKGNTVFRYALPRYLKGFGHYPSYMLRNDQSVRLTPTGRGLVDGELGLPLYYNNQWQYLDANIIKRVLQGVIHMDAKGQTLTIGRILSVITKDGQAPETRQLVFRHVLWLLKYGFIQLSEPKNRSRQ